MAHNFEEIKSMYAAQVTYDFNRLKDCKKLLDCMESIANKCNTLIENPKQDEHARDVKFFENASGYEHLIPKYIANETQSTFVLNQPRNALRNNETTA